MQASLFASFFVMHGLLFCFAPASCSMMLLSCYAAAVVFHTTIPVPYHCVICKTCVASLDSALQNASVLRTDSRFFEPLLFSLRSDHGTLIHFVRIMGPSSTSWMQSHDLFVAVLLSFVGYNVCNLIL